MGLSLEKDEELYHRMKQGDESARDELILSVQHVVTFHARNMAFNDNIYEDLVGEGNLAVVTCVDKWEFQKKPFMNYAWAWVRISMLKYLQKKNRMFRDKNPEIIYIDNEEINEPEMLFHDEHKQMEYDNLYNVIYDILSEREKQIVNLIYFEELNMYEIAERLNIKYQTVASLLSNLRKRIKKRFNKKDLGLES